MSYRIVYGPEITVPVQKSNSRWRIQMLTAVFLFLFVVTVRICWPQGTEMLRSWLLPGQPGVTEAALFDMMEGLRDGATTGEALTDFCWQIIHGQIY